MYIICQLTSILVNFKFHKEMRLGLWCLTPLLNNISAISWRSVLFVEEAGENHRPTTSQWQASSHGVSSTPRHGWPVRDN